MQRWDLHRISTPEGTRSPVVLHSEEEARAVLVELRPGQELGDHQVKEHAWVVVVDGSVVATAEGDSVEAGAGTLLRFDPDERRALSSVGGARVLLLLAPWPGDGHYRGGGGPLG